MKSRVALIVASAGVRSQVPSMGRSGRPRENLHGVAVTVIPRARKTVWRKLYSQTSSRKSVWRPLG